MGSMSDGMPDGKWRATRHAECRTRRVSRTTLRRRRRMMQHSTPMQRRTLLKYGFGGLVVVGLGGAGAALWRPGVSNGRLSKPGREIFTALALAILDGCLPVAVSERA